MYRLEREQFLEFPVILLWPLLGFQAGFINSFGFLACGRYVSHVTGFGTQIGISVAQNQWLIAFELLGFPLFFIFGAFFSGFFTCARRERGLKPRYDLITLFLPLIILLISFLGIAGVFSPFGEDLRVWRDFILLYTLSFACGLQNGCFATLTKGQIRTTHLTGISTDIGTDFARMYFGKLSDLELKLVKKANLSRISTFLAFALGSIFSVTTTQKFHYIALFVPFATSIVVYLGVAALSHRMDKIFGRLSSAA